MEKTYQFKTNVKCGGCIAAITPGMTSNSDIHSWKVDLNDPDRILTVVVEGMEEIQVREILEKAGYKAEFIPQG